MFASTVILLIGMVRFVRNSSISPRFLRKYGSQQPISVYRYPDL